MEIDVALVPREARVAGPAVLIVVDQFRASTTITTLLDLGCSDVYIEGAVAAAKRLGRATGSILVGERHAVRPPGFDFDNSPTMLSRADVRGRSAVLSTTNGTAILRRVRAAEHVLVGCLRNARACAEAAVELALAGTGGIQVVCAGWEQRFVLEDAVAAGVIVTRIVDALRARGEEPWLTDAATAATRLRDAYPDAYTAILDADGGRTLAEIGQEEDTAFCAQEDRSTTVPVLQDGSPMRVVRLGHAAPGHARSSPGRSVRIASLPNLRDVGGLPTRDGARVRTGLLYRSTDLSRLEGDDAEAFAGLGIRTVYDLRTESERATQPDRLPPGTALVVADVLADAPEATPAQIMDALNDPKQAAAAFGDGRGAAMFVGKYREFVRLGSARAAYRRLFADVATAEHRPALFHCTTGKDRTGWAAAALLLLLGVAEDVVMEDYLASTPLVTLMFQPFVDRFEARGGDPDLLLPLIGVQPAYLQAALDEMRAAYGTIEGYFADGLGIDVDGQRALRAVFLKSH
jgi:protein-tyrosine phosphatase